MRPLAFIQQRLIACFCPGQKKIVRACIYFTLLSAFMFAGNGLVKAQYQVVDIAGVERAIAVAKSDTARTRLYGILGWELRFANPAESERLADEIIRLAAPVNDHLRLAEAYQIKGFARVLEQNLPECLNMYEQALAHAKKANNFSRQAYIMALKAGMYQDKADYDQAIRYYLEAVRTAEISQDKSMIAFTANCIAEAYSDAGRPISFTLPFYERAMKLEMDLGNWQYVGMIWSNIAKDRMLAGDRKEAERAAAQAIIQLRKKSDRAYVYATVMTDLGEMYAGLGRYDVAEQYLQESLQILDSLKTKDNVLIPLSALARLYIKRNEPVKAEKAAQRLLQLATAYRTKLFIRNSYEVLSDVARARKQPELALNYFEQYKNWNDSVFNESREKAIAGVEARMKLQQRDLEAKYELTRKSQENQLLKQSNTDLQNRVIAAIIIVAIVTIAGIGITGAYRAARRRNEILKNQREIIERQSLEKDTLLREINHRVKNNLQIISSLLNLQANALSDPRAVDALRDSHKRVKAISLIHQKLYGFDELAAVPIQSYIHSLYEELRVVYNAGNVTLSCTTDPEHLALDIGSAVPLGLILNESLTNALKYAFNNRADGIIEIGLTESEGNYRLVISDNGPGLPPGFDPANSSTLGFRIIQQLTRQLRGQFNYASDNGTTLTIRFPGTEARKKLN